MKNPLEYYNGEDGLRIYVTGEIDHHNCESLRTATDELISKLEPSKVTLDLRDVTFCDSSGIAFLLGRYKMLSVKNKAFTVVNVPAQPYKIFTLASVDKLISISPLQIPAKSR